MKNLFKIFAFSVISIFLFGLPSFSAKKQELPVDPKKYPQIAQAIQAQQEEAKKSGGTLAVGTQGNDILTLRIDLAAFDIEGMLRLNMVSGDVSDNDMLFGISVIKIFVDGKRVKVNLFGSIIMDNYGDSTTTSYDGLYLGRSNMYIRAGLAPEIFITDNLSLETSFGLQINTIGASNFGNDAYTQIATYSSNSNLNLGIALRAYIF